MGSRDEVSRSNRSNTNIWAFFFGPLSLLFKSAWMPFTAFDAVRFWYAYLYRCDKKNHTLWLFLFLHYWLRKSKLRIFFWGGGLEFNQLYIILIFSDLHFYYITTRKWYQDASGPQRANVCNLNSSFFSLLSCSEEKHLLNNGCNPLPRTETLSTLHFKSLFPFLSRHIPLFLIKCRSRAPCVTCTTLVNLSCHCQAGRRVCKEMSNKNMFTSQIFSRCSPLLTLETLCFPVTMETPNAKGSFSKMTGADKSWKCVNKTLGEK